MGKINKFCAFALLSSALLVLHSNGVHASDSEDMVLKKSGQPGRLDFSEPIPRDKIVLNSTGNVVGTPAALTNDSSPASISTGSALRTAGMCLIFLGGAAGLLVLYYRRRNGLSGVPAAGKRMEILEKISLGPQREVLLLRACDRLLLIGSQGGQFTMLSDLPTENSPSQPFNDLVEDAIPSDLETAYATRARAPQQTQPTQQTQHSGYSHPVNPNHRTNVVQQKSPLTHAQQAQQMLLARQQLQQLQQYHQVPQQIPQHVSGDFYSSDHVTPRPSAPNARSAAPSPAPAAPSIRKSAPAAEDSSIVDSIQFSAAAAQAWPDMETGR